MHAALFGLSAFKKNGVDEHRRFPSASLIATPNYLLSSLLYLPLTLLTFYTRTTFFWHGSRRDGMGCNRGLGLVEGICWNEGWGPRYDFERYTFLF